MASKLESMRLSFCKGYSFGVGVQCTSGQVAHQDAKWCRGGGSTVVHMGCIGGLIAEGEQVFDISLGPNRKGWNMLPPQ
jgi:hypothetical protein